MPKLLKDYFFFDYEFAQTYFWIQIRLLREEVFKDLANGPLKAFEPLYPTYKLLIDKYSEKAKGEKTINKARKAAAVEDGKQIREFLVSNLIKTHGPEEALFILNRYNKQIDSWKQRSSLDYDWITIRVGHQLIYWMENEDLRESLTPTTLEGPKDPFTEDVIFPELDLESRRIIWFDIDEPYQLPDEAYFKFSDVWLMHLGESWTEARNRMRKNFEDQLLNYKAMFEEKTQNLERFRPVHFEWLVRRIVPPIESIENIRVTGDENCESADAYDAGILDTATISRPTNDLAKFIGVSIPGARKRRPST